MLPREHQQEVLSFAYVRAIAVRAGLVCGDFDRDYGIDLTLRNVRQNGNTFVDGGVQIDVQLKSTTRANVMKFRNPWVDPRVLQVKSAHAEAYLHKRGWFQIPGVNSNFHTFTNSNNKADASVVCVAQLEQADDFSQRMIELIAALANVEDRYAGDVLSDILQVKNEPSVGNGLTTERAAS